VCACRFETLDIPLRGLAPRPAPPRGGFAKSKIAIMSFLLLALLMSSASAMRLSKDVLGILQLSPTELTDVTSYMALDKITSGGYRCCCDKSKGGMAGLKDVARGISERAEYCTVLQTDSCGDVSVAPETQKAHSHDKVHDGKCEIPKAQLSDFIKIVGCPGIAWDKNAEGKPNVPESLPGKTVMVGCPPSHKAASVMVTCTEAKVFDPVPACEKV